MYNFPQKIEAVPKQIDFFWGKNFRKIGLYLLEIQKTYFTSEFSPGSNFAPMSVMIIIIVKLSLV